MSGSYSPLFTGKGQQSLKAWIQLQVAKPQTWAQLYRAAQANRRQRRVHGGSEPPAPAIGAGSQSWAPIEQRRGLQTLALTGGWAALRAASAPLLLPRLLQWYGPCCLGELTLLSGIGSISRAHCFQGLWLQGLVFFLSPDMSGH